MYNPVTYDEICHYAGGSQCVNEGMFVLKVAELFAAEASGRITISTEAKNKLRERWGK